VARSGRRLSRRTTRGVHDLCDGYGIDFILGQAVNTKLKQLGAPLMDQVEALAKQTEKPVRLFSSFDYQARSWGRPRRIIHKAEITQGKANPRFVVTNIGDRTERFLYEKLYCGRGRMEGFIKDHKTFLHSDRTSCHHTMDSPQRRQLVGIHAVQGRAAWDRQDVPYLPEHRAIAEAKPF
jgi:hypothetical protein